VSSSGRGTDSSELDLDDLPPHMFIKGAANSHGFVDADVTLKVSSISPHFKQQGITIESSCGRSTSSTSTESTTGSSFP
jgi:hypothetical protein